MNGSDNQASRIKQEKEQGALAANAYLTCLLDSSPDAIIATDKEGRLHS